jgi:hypothetical protein
MAPGRTRGPVLVWKVRNEFSKEVTMILNASIKQSFVLLPRIGELPWMWQECPVWLNFGGCSPLGSVSQSRAWCKSYQGDRQPLGSSWWCAGGFWVSIGSPCPLSPPCIVSGKSWYRNQQGHPVLAAQTVTNGPAFRRRENWSTEDKSSRSREASAQLLRRNSISTLSLRQWNHRSPAWTA